MVEAVAMALTAAVQAPRAPGALEEVLLPGIGARPPGRARCRSSQSLRVTRRSCNVAAAAGAADPSSRRPVVILPGLGNNTGDYDVLARDLQQRGLTTAVAQVSRPDWLRNAAGLLDVNYWKGTLSPRPVLDWYLERMEKAIAEAKAQAHEGAKVSLVGHSAGGWLARLFLAEIGTQDVAVLCTLGTPHLAPPRGVPGVVDQTRGLLYYINDNSPGAFHPEVKYVCVAGRYLKGLPLFGKASGVEVKAPATAGTGGDPMAGGGSGAAGAAGAALAAAEVVATAGVGGGGPVLGGEQLAEAPPSVQARIVGQGYKQVCGEAEVWGDGVVPVSSAHLEGAENLSIDGVYHSPVGANSNGRPWYGSPGVLEKWLHHLLD